MKATFNANFTIEIDAEYDMAGLESCLSHYFKHQVGNSVNFGCEDGFKVGKIVKWSLLNVLPDEPNAKE